MKDSQEKILAVIGLVLNFSREILTSMSLDFDQLFGKKDFWFFRRFRKRNHFKLLSNAHSLYLKNQAKLSFLHNRWKYLLKIKVESENEYNKLITKIDKSTGEPIAKEDRNQNIKIPTFEDDKPHLYENLKEGYITPFNLSPSLFGLGVSSKIIAGLSNQINKLSYEHLGKILRETKQFRKFPEVVSDQSNYQQSQGITEKNILAAITATWVFIILIAYASALAAEITVFQNIAENLLGLAELKSWLFALTILGVSFLLGIYFYAPIKLFLQSDRSFIPAIFKVYIVAIVLYVIATGFLNFEQYQYRKLENRYQIEISNLSNLQSAFFMNPEDSSIQNDLQLQEQKVKQIESTLSTPSELENFLARLLYILAGFIALATSALILAVKLIVSKVLKYKYKYERCTRQIVSVKTDYQHYLSVHKKARELLGNYLILLGRYQALECLQVMSPTANELINPDGTDSFENPSQVMSDFEDEVKAGNLEVENFEEIISETESSETGF